MAYFAIQCVSGRELLVKSYIERAIRNHKRTDIKEIIVPSHTSLDLKEISENRYSSKTVALYTSYIFVKAETSNTIFEEISADLYHFLITIPNIQSILKYSVDKAELEALFNNNCIHSSQMVVFKVEDDSISTHASVLTKAKEVIEKNKIVSKFKRYVQTLFRGIKTKGIYTISVKDIDGGCIITAPLTLIMEALAELPYTLDQFIKAPHRLIQSLVRVCHANIN